MVKQNKKLKTRLRRLADNEGLRILKSRLRHPRADNFGLYQLIEERRKIVVLGPKTTRRCKTLRIIWNETTAKDAMSGSLHEEQLHHGGVNGYANHPVFLSHRFKVGRSTSKTRS